jgi:hypothetical protein
MLDTLRRHLIVYAGPPDRLLWLRLIVSPRGLLKLRVAIDVGAIFSSILRRGHDDERVAAESIQVRWPHYDAERGPASFVSQMRSLDVNDTLSVSPKLVELDLPARVVWAKLDVIDQGKYFTPEDGPERVGSGEHRRKGV